MLTFVLVVLCVEMAAAMQTTALLFKGRVASVQQRRQSTVVKASMQRCSKDRILGLGCQTFWCSLATCGMYQRGVVIGLPACLCCTASMQ